MALLDSEIQRIRYEVGANVLTIDAEPRIDHLAIFEQVIQQYTQAGAATTSSTTVAAASSPTPATLTLASGTGFSAGDVVIVDVDSRQERVTAQSVSGASLTVLLSLAHTGTYPVTVEGGESVVRGLLRRCVAVGDQIAEATSTAGIKRVDEIEFFGDSAASNQLTALRSHLMFWRDQLASALGLPNFWRRNHGRSVALY